jgi:signal transduction histidine kinase
MSLKWKLALLTSGLLCAAVGAFSAVLLWTERRSLEDAQARRQREAVEGLAVVCRGAAVNEQDLPLANYLKRLGASEEVLEARCVDVSGRVIGHTDTARLQTVPAEEASPAPGSILVEGPVAVGQKTLGTARIVYDGRLLRERLEDTLAVARKRVVRVSLTVGLAGFTLAFLATAWAVGPVRTLVEGVRAVAKGRWEHRIAVSAKDEIGWLAEEFNRMAGRLSELDRMKSDFVHGVTHDLKSPLTAMKASADNLQTYLDKPGDPAAARDSLSVIRRNADRLMNLITSILEVAKIENGLVLASGPVDLEAMADRVVRAFKPSAQGKGLTLELVAENLVPPFPADEGKLERVVSNLVGNAVKFTEKGGVTVSLAREHGMAVLSVRDTGPGIPDGFRDRLFTKFSRAEAAGRKVEGTGLGLAIAKGIVEAHGGTLEARNDPGAVFTVRLPLP